MSACKNKYITLVNYLETPYPGVVEIAEKKEILIDNIERLDDTDIKLEDALHSIRKAVTGVH